MGLIWLLHPVLWHSDRMPMGYNYTAMTPYELKLITTHFTDWYTADWDYARTTVYFFCAAIFIFMLGYVVFALRHAGSAVTAEAAREMPFYTKGVAILRYFTAKQFHVRLSRWYSPPLGPMTIVACMFIFAMALMLGARPYYWPDGSLLGNSPPIATRSGWISIAMLPFLMMFASKVNLIGIVTGTSHEKLQVYHRWVAWIMYITSLVHTFPFIVFRIKMGTMVVAYTTTPWYWTGIAALIPQTWLVLMSWGPIRNRYYETFKKLHVIAAGIFVPALFIHCNFRLTSWDYFWATAACYGLTWFARYGRMLYNGLGMRASFETLPDNMLKVSIPTTLKWRPGQHYFVRFLDLGIHAASSHPFTVASVAEKSANGRNVMEFYARIHEGITLRLATLNNGNKNRASRVLLDGPYGGFEGSLKVYDRTLLLAGGTGLTFVLPLLRDLVASFNDPAVVCRQVRLIWAVRSAASLSWFEDELNQVLAIAPKGSVSIVCYVTGSTSEDDVSDASISKVPAVETALTTQSGRPMLPAIVQDFCNAKGTVGIAACGPSSFNLDVRNAVADRELAIARGASPCEEIYMHAEAYGW